MSPLPDLVTLADAVTALSAAGFAPTGTRLAALPAQITAASGEIRRFCGDRAFTRTTFTEDHPVELDGGLFLDQFPLIQITRIAGGRATGLALQADPNINRRATVAGVEDGSGLVLTRVAAGVSSSATILYSSAPTLQALATAINALAGGWSATVATGQGDCPATDLVVDPTPRDTRQACNLAVFAEDVAARHVDWDTGLVVLDCEHGGSVRVTYDAGFTTVPTAVQMATALLANYHLDNLGRDLGLQSETVGAGSYTARAGEGMPVEVLSRIAPYQIVRV